MAQSLISESDMVNYCDPSVMGSHLAPQSDGIQELIEDDSSIGEDIDFVLSRQTEPIDEQTISKGNLELSLSLQELPPLPPNKITQSQVFSTGGLKQHIKHFQP